VCSLVYLTIASLANVSDPGLAQRTLDTLLPPLLVRLNEEHDSEIMYTIAEALSEQTRLCYDSLTDGAAIGQAVPVGGEGAVKSTATPHTTCMVSLSSAEALFKAVQAAMYDSMDRRKMSAKQLAANPDSDADDMEGLKEDLAVEDEFMVNLVDTVGFVIKQHRSAIMPLVAATIGKCCVCIQPPCEMMRD